MHLRQGLLKLLIPIGSTHWLYASGQIGIYPAPTARCGKWLLFVPVTLIDDAWAKIKSAVEEGRLGDSAKVATALPSPNASSSAERVICVYTYDWTDVVDVRRIREELRHLGFTRKIPYKANEDTHVGRYQVHGHTPISKYYE
jgi:hypothetical protein